MSSSLFPPQTKEVQFDERWAFVEKKEKNCESDEDKKGDNWDHVAFDPEHRLVVSCVPGKRTKANVEALVGDFAERTDHRVMNIISSDEYKPYKQAILQEYGEEVPQPRRFKRGRPPKSKLLPTDNLLYATVHKTRKNGRVVKKVIEIIFGTVLRLAVALKASSVSTTVNTSFVERYNATGRHRNGRKTRKTYRFSKNWDIHNGMTWFEVGTYNFCWAVSSLTKEGPDGQRIKRSPAMAAGLTDHVWTIEEWIKFPVILHSED